MNCMERYRVFLGAVAVAALAALPFGCRNTAEGVKKDARENTEEAKEESREAAKEAKEAGRELGAEARQAGREAGAEVQAAKQTMDVKLALMTDSSIDASKINVDTDDETKTVTLKGTVPSAAQKAAAERVAKANAEGYKIRNMLTVAR
jgi:hyperosmotically inducible periplasmic protein